MCLAIPGQIVEVVDDERRLAKVDVAGVRRMGEDYERELEELRESVIE